MMPILHWAVIITLSSYVIAMVLATVRMLLGPSSQDRILAADFIYNVGTLFILVLSIYFVSITYYEIAFLMALFGFISSVSLAKFLIRGEVIE